MLRAVPACRCFQRPAQCSALFQHGRQCDRRQPRQAGPHGGQRGPAAPRRIARPGERSLQPPTGREGGSLHRRDGGPPAARPAGALRPGAGRHLPALGCHHGAAVGAGGCRPRGIQASARHLPVPGPGDARPHAGGRGRPGRDVPPDRRPGREAPRQPRRGHDQRPAGHGSGTRKHGLDGARAPEWSSKGWRTSAGGRSSGRPSPP